MPALSAVRLFGAETAPRAIFNTGPYAAYDSVSDRTFIGYLGLSRDLYVVYFDHATETVSTPVLVDTHTSVDDHGAPSLVIDNDGHLHMVWGAHNTSHRHVKSDSPRDISAWTGQTLTGDGTYPLLAHNPANGDLYLIDRTGGPTHSGTFPSHEFGGLRKSTDGGATWSSASMIVDTTGVPEDTSDFYPVYGGGFAPDGNLHFIWSVSRGTSHDQNRTNLYHAYLDPSDDSLHAADGTSLGASIDWSEHPTCQIATRDSLRQGSTAFGGSEILVAYGDVAADQAHYFAMFDGTSWTDSDPGIDNWDTMGFQQPFYDEGWHALLSVDNGGSSAHLDLYSESGGTWSRVETVMAGLQADGFLRVKGVTGGGPAVGLVMQSSELGDPETNATSSDLLPMWLVSEGLTPPAPPTRPMGRYPSRYG